MRARVKICGITRPGDALLAAELGADAIGLIFWPQSPRAVTIAQAAAIVEALPALVPAIGVFVNQMEDIDRVLAEVPLAGVQLHGDEPAHIRFARPVRLIKSVAVRGRDAIDLAAQVPIATTVLLDAHDVEKRGGTGRTINWAIAAEIAATRRTILAGGLTPDTAPEAIRAVRPTAIDVSSGVESAPGRKDPAKLRALFAAVRDL